MEHLSEEKPLAPVGILQAQSSAHTVLWSVKNSFNLWSDNVHLHSPPFSVPVLPNHLFILSLAFQKHGLIIQVTKRTNTLLLPKSVQLCIEVKIALINSFDKEQLNTKLCAFGDTASISFSLKRKDVDTLLNNSGLGIQCYINIDQSEKVGHNISIHKKHNAHKSTITLQEFQEHLMVMLDGETDRILIKVDGEVFPVHQNMLTLHSPVFSAMFQHETLENKEKCIHIDDSSKEVIGEMLKYIYTGKTSDLSPVIAMELYVFADKYSITQLKTHCSNFLAFSLTNEFVFDVLVLADHCCDEKLKNMGIRFLIENGHDIIQTEEFVMFLKTESETARNIFLHLIKQAVL